MSDLRFEIEELRKLRGGYYTPEPIAAFMTRWAIRSGRDQILEPSCGDGVFLDAIETRLSGLKPSSRSIGVQICAIEYNRTEAQKAIGRIGESRTLSQLAEVSVGDFFEWCKNALDSDKRFDCVLGNPPFIRYQDFPQRQRTVAFGLMARAGLRPNRLTNMWIPFLISSGLLLKESGRLAMVIPAELFQVNYAAQVRQFLSRFYQRITIVTFRELVFAGVQQEVVLLLAEKQSHLEKGIRVIELGGVSDLATLRIGPSSIPAKQLDHSQDKWTQYYLERHEIELLREIKQASVIPVSGQYLNVDVGVVTGRNEFFVMPEEDLVRLGLTDNAVRVIGRSAQLKGVTLTEQDWRHLQEKSSAWFMINLPDVAKNALPKAAQDYITHGERKGFQVGYKCRIRKHWWAVPSVWKPDAFMLRQVHAFPKLVLNRSSATATDTLHRVRFINGLPGDVLASGFLNSMTFAFSEVTGRSYGGGVLTFEPTEAERLPLPITKTSAFDLEAIDLLMRQGRIEDILDMNDKQLLSDQFGLSKKDLKTLRLIWMKLRDRRIHRRDKPIASRQFELVLP